MALGPRDTASLKMLSGWDATVLQNYSLEDGTSFLAVAQMIDNALVALRGEFAGDWLSNLYSIQDIPEVEYRVGVSNGFTEHTEYGRPDAQRAQTEGHLLPIKAYDRMLGWTWDYLQQARMSQIEADIANAIQDARDKRRVAILTRMLKRGDDSGANSGLGSSGYSPGFATDAGTTNVDFTPPMWNGTSFTSAHEHYVPIAGGVFTGAVFSDAKDELREHGHEPPFEFVIGPSDEATVRGLTSDGFVAVNQNLVIYGDSTNRTALQAGADASGSYYIGTIWDFAVRVMPGMPRYYGFGYKSYGRLSTRNPLAIRVAKGQSTLDVVAMPDPNAGSGILPLQRLMLYTKFGVGVRDRTAATPRYVNAGAWTDGTPT